MIQRLLQRILGLLVLLVVLSFALRVVAGLLRQGGAVATISITHVVPNILASVVVTLMTGVFCIGLGVRIHQFLTGHGGPSGRERDARERQVQRSVRRPAEGVPPMNVRREAQGDPDPAVGDDEEGR